MKYKNREEQRRVNDIMASLLLPLKNHADEKTNWAIETALWILQHTGIEDGGETK